MHIDGDQRNKEELEMIENSKNVNATRQLRVLSTSNASWKD
jgi:hypothetical protein